MTKSDIAFVEKNVGEPEVRAEAEKQIGREIDGAPITLVGREVIDGFDRKAILKALGR
ncbi:hypothetical protein FWH09_01800 [Candidatus Saccharibacteria bacterium]|nr:hypothetical protein [Candidatus Saccharibacteria bacterium]